MHTEDCYQFAALDDAFSTLGDGYGKVPLSLLCNTQSVLLPGHRSSAPSVHAYVAALPQLAQMARNVHASANERGSAVLEFLQSLEDDESVPETIRVRVPDMIGSLSALLNAADMGVAVPNVHRDNL
jgi:hypothetical protein